MTDKRKRTLIPLIPSRNPAKRLLYGLRRRRQGISYLKPTQVVSSSQNATQPATEEDVVISIKDTREATALQGDVTLSPGTDIGLTTVGQDIEIAYTGAAIGGTWFLYDTASGDIAGYDTLLLDPSSGAKQTYTIAVPSSPTLIEEFATEIGAPSTTFINDGILELHFHGRRSAGTKDIRVYAELYTRTHPGAAETLVATTEESNQMTNTEASYEIHAVVPFTVMATTDRLVVKVYANQEGTGSNPTVELFVEGTTNTRIELPSADTGAALSHTISTAIVKGAAPTVITLETGVGNEARDFFVNVMCRDLNGAIIWPALGSRFPVANLITYYWIVDSGSLDVYIVNDSAKDVEVIIWWTR